MGIRSSSPASKNENNGPGSEAGDALEEIKTVSSFHQQNRVKDMARLITAESRRKRALKKDVYDRKKENLQLLKHLFKKMDPSVMKTVVNSNHGSVQMSFKYEASRELLLVKVIRGRDLSARDLMGRTADPYVKMFLHPSLEKDVEMRTETAKKTLNPVYNEIFSFPISSEQLQGSKIILQVWDHDLMDHDDIIGEAIISLSMFDFQETSVHTAWFSLQTETDLDVSGDLELTLNYEAPQKLLVTVHRGNNLTNRHGAEGCPNPFVKVQIPGIEDIHQTETNYNTVNPVWEKTFEFEVPLEDFGNRFIIFHAVDYDDSEDNDSLGQLIIELENLDPETGYHGAFQLADLKNNERMRAKWFQSATVQEFREALTAHTLFQQPKFLFTQHTGTKVVRLSSRRAGTQAKLHIVNGIPVY